MFKPAEIIFCGALLILVGCTSAPRNSNAPLPRDWSLPGTVPAPIPPQNTQEPVAAPGQRNGPPQKISQPAPILTWTSLNRWASANNLSQPKRVVGSPVVSFAISSPKGTLILGIGSREAMWRNVEIHLGFPPQIIDDQVFVHGLDLQKNLEPLLLSRRINVSPQRILVLDPGHGGPKTGTVSVRDGRPEKDFTLDWARRIQSLLNTNGWTVFLTRTNDADVALSNRVGFAEALHADLFVSLHFNSSAPDKKQSGIETYCLTPTGMPSTLTRGYSDLWTDRYPNNAFDVENLQLAFLLHAALLRASGEEDRGIRRARFMTVLQGQQRPAVLIEGGFLSNPHEADKIENPEFRQKLAVAVANALQ